VKEILEKIDKMNTAPYSDEERNFCYARGINDVRKLILSEQSEQKEPCEWTQEDEDSNTWECNKCGLLWPLNDGTPQENDINFCPNCGRSLTQSPTNN
jgi:rubrerythrin